MPVKTEMNVKPLELERGDCLMWWARDDVASGVTKLNAGMVVRRQTLKISNVKVVFENNAEVLFRSDADLRISRDVKTDEEKAEETRRWRDQAIRREMNKALAAPAATRAKIAKKLEDTDHRMGESIAELGAQLAAEEAVAGDWLIVLRIVLDPEHSKHGELVDVFDEYRTRLAEELLRRGADDSWSGRICNDVHRGIYDARRELVSNQWL